MVKILSEEHKKKIGESVREWHKLIGFSKETRKKISENNRFHKISDEGKKRISLANKGRPAWNKGLTKEDPRVRLNIERRTNTIKRLYAEGKLKPWNLGRPWSEEVKMKISIKRKGKTYEEIMGVEKAIQFKKKLSEIMKKRVGGRNNPMYGWSGDKNPHFGKPAHHGKYSFRKDLGHHCRSKWEANYARYLLWIGKKYQYEAKNFIISLDNGTKATYTPDFLVENHEWHELKGWETRNKLKKWEIFEKQYPDEKFVFVDRKKYKEIAHMHQYIIPNWEF